MSPPRDGGTAAISYNELLVLQALARGSRYGLEVMTATGLSSGTVYPILRRAAARGWVSSRRERAAEAHAEGRPARRLHGITVAGEAVLAEARAELVARQRALGLLAGEG